MTKLGNKVQGTVDRGGKPSPRDGMVGRKRWWGTGGRQEQEIWTCKSSGFQSFNDCGMVLPLFHPSCLPPHIAYCVLQSLSPFLCPSIGLLTEIGVVSLPWGAVIAAPVTDLGLGEELYLHCGAQALELHWAHVFVLLILYPTIRQHPKEQDLAPGPVSGLRSPL